MGILSNLLRWKKQIILRDASGTMIMGEDETPMTVWVRIISDKDLEDAFKKARIKSARTRADLVDEVSEDYQALIAPFDSASRDQCYDMALAGMGANWMGEAISTVIRPDLVKINEVARDPDAPSLEEQELLDKKNREGEEGYQKRLMEFLTTKTSEAKAILDAMTDEELRIQAKTSVIITVPLEAFLSELNDEKMWRAVFLDEKCTQRGFSDVEDYRSSTTVIKEQIVEAYQELEAGHSDIKN